MKRKIFIILLLVVICVFTISGCQNNQSVNNIDNNLQIEIIDKMALSYIQSRQSETKFSVADEGLYFVYLRINVKNINSDGEDISFGSNYSDYYAKLDIGRAVNQGVYFEENKHLNDRIPYWCPLGDYEAWNKIVFATSNVDITIVEANQSREFFLAFLALESNKDYDLSLKIYKKSFLRDKIVGEINIGKIQITE